MFKAPTIVPGISEPEDLIPASPDDLASALAFALRFFGRRRTHNADEMMAEIVARRRSSISSAQGSSL